MAQRTTPTERQQRLGAELRKLRTTAGMSAEYAAGLLGVDRSRLSNMEAGLRPINPERLRTLACNCDCRDEKYVDALAAMTQASRGWWEKYRGSLPAGLLDIAEFEWHAVRMRTAHTVHIPGLLQTSDHATTIFRVGVPPMPEHEIALRVAHRMERRQVLDSDDPCEYIGIIHEAALRMQFGGRAIALAQLKHLLAMSECDHVTLRVIPFEAGEFPGAGQTVIYAEGAVPQLDAVQVDSTHGPEFLHLEAQLTRYRSQMDGMERVSLSPERSRDFIQSIVRQL
ncbi:helix-turn-helix transcriptional regulator [Streptomyces decoyicus]|uniref:helix-turn-helix domain-containing protein n=1 Tax=Streptomyces decoyicus TaxID=249567 RepID=UPI002E183991|nr:helix-turn-helix transcriptional regulator [Streptomyces decoyicus]